MASLKRFLKRSAALRKAFWRVLTGEVYMSFSQYGEDLLLRSFMADIFDDVNYKGFWVDVGAHDPFRFSNTKMFSDRGWTGINIDAMPGAIEKFKKARPRDVNVNVGVGPEKGELDYYMFADYATNTFSRDFAERMSANGANLLGTRKVQVKPLREILDEHVPKDRHIDFFSIDTEGLDLTILQSNDWKLYRPDYILIEIHTGGKNWEIPSCSITKYLNDHGYAFAGQGYVTTLYQRVR